MAVLHPPSASASSEGSAVPRRRARVQSWEALYNQVPLCDMPRHFAGIRQSPFMQTYLATVLTHCPRGGRSLETGIGSGLGAIWLSLRGAEAEGIDYAPALVERARQINNLLGGKAHFRVGDLFALCEPDKPIELAPLYHVIHHQGVLEHFTVPEMRAALAQQVALARWVVFSVPSVFYPFGPEFGDERLLPLEEWARILSPFEVEELRYYGDPRHGEEEHILCVLRGAPADGCLRALMRVPPRPFAPGISAIVHTRNEERHISECLQSLQVWTDEIIVCDMESQDGTVEVAQKYTHNIIRHPLILNFDRARNVSALRASHEWVFYLDADERVPEALGQALRALVEREGESFEAVLLPFRHIFAHHWMQCLYPGYTAPRLLKNGRFFFNPRLHAGTQVDGRIVRFPADDPELSILHHSYDSLSHYLEKLNRYTDGEALNLHRDGARFHWQGAIRHFVTDLKSYYDHGQAAKDGVHGLLWSFLSGFYRFEQHAKLFERRFNAQQLERRELELPGSAEELLQFALQVAREEPLPPTPQIQVVREAGDGGGEGLLRTSEQDAAELVWTGPLLDPSGYGEEGRHLLLAADRAGVKVSGSAIAWSRDRVALEPAVKERLDLLFDRSAKPGFVHVVHNFAPGFFRHPDAGVCIGRTQFETDRLPFFWVKACNQMDYVWIPSEFNRQTFAQSGVEEKKLVVVPAGLDAAPYQVDRTNGPLPPALRAIRDESDFEKRFTFLSVFDWTLHKGWDVLLRAFLEEFGEDEPVQLVLKVWSTMGYSAEQIQEQAAALVRDELGRDLPSDPRILFLHERLSTEQMIALYQLSDCYVLPSRGEGWGRPYMEAMACGKPVIATNWSGSTAFLREENSYLVDADMVPVPEAGWREIPTYQGHRWAEPDREALRLRLRRVFTEQGEAAIIGARAREYVLSQLSPERVGQKIAEELARVQEARRSHLVLVDGTATEPAGENGEGAEDEEASEEPAATASIPVRWEGAQFMVHSLAHVNRELCLGLLQTGRVELSLVSTEPVQLTHADEPRLAALEERCFVPLSQPAQVHVRHFFPPRFTRPDEGKLVLIQPWEYGYLPERWIAPIQQNVDEVWCYSTYVRQVYERSGLAPGKLHVLPLGVDTQVFHPDALPFVFTSQPGARRLREIAERCERWPSRPLGGAAAGLDEPFLFLYVGGTIHRKGIDILLEAYTKAFTPYDNVCLVIKDMGTGTVYAGQNERERILQLAADPEKPALVYLEDDLTPQELAGIYTACDCLVMPYRGEGFCLPALEAMSCGLPVIVPEGGPTDDFVDEAVGWRVPALRWPIPGDRVGDLDLVGPGWTLEVSPFQLGQLMRQVVASRLEARDRGRRGAERVRENWTWQHATQRVLQRLEALSQTHQPTPEPPVSLAQSTPPQEDPEVERVAARLLESLEELVAEDRPNGNRNRSGHSNGSGLPDNCPQPHTDGDDPLVPAAETAVALRPQPTLSLCMIARNEERVLADCLKSVKPWVDEIVLVDTGSSDRTVEIAHEFGCRVVHFPWVDDFSAARNRSLEEARGDWVLWMDADDTLPEECGRKLKELVALAEDFVTGYVMQVHIPPAPGDAGFTIVDHVKLFRNGPALRFEGRIHEQILESIYRAGGVIERTNLFVVHSGYDHSPEGQKRKRERDWKLLDLDLSERPEHPFVWFNIGMTHFHLKEFAEAIPALHRCLELAKPRESIVRKVYAMLAGSCLETGDKGQARTWLEKGLALFHRDPELLFRAGAIYRELGEFVRAEQAYRTLLSTPDTGHLDSLDVTMTGFKAHVNLALLLQDMGRLHEAEQEWRRATEQEPAFVPAWLGLAELLLRGGRLGEVEGIASRLESLAPQEAARLKQRLKGAMLSVG